MKFKLSLLLFVFINAVAKEKVFEKDIVLTTGETIIVVWYEVRHNILYFKTAKGKKGKVDYDKVKEILISKEEDEFLKKKDKPEKAPEKAPEKTDPISLFNEKGIIDLSKFRGLSNNQFKKKAQGINYTEERFNEPGISSVFTIKENKVWGTIIFSLMGDKVFNIMLRPKKYMYNPFEIENFIKEHLRINLKKSKSKKDSKTDCCKHSLYRGIKSNTKIYDVRIRLNEETKKTTVTINFEDY
ncbi:MAG: hypothetical protein HRT89_13410 [Lentisphaeria bacterium]|nr:hypothetical protein [Lentisphaeria bacterium]